MRVELRVEGCAAGAGEGSTLGARLALRPLARLRGLLFAPLPEPGEGLLLAPCHAVHTAFVPEPIDVVFLDGGLRVLGVVPSLAPWRTASRSGAAAVLELRGGEARRLGIGEGGLLRAAGLPGASDAPAALARALAPSSGPSPRAEATLLLAILAAGAAVRLLHLGADPFLALAGPGGLSHAEVQDGPRYLAPTIDAWHGRPLSEAARDARWPLLQLLGRAAFSLAGGPGADGLHLVGALPGLALPLLGWGAIRPLCGARAALAAAALAALSLPLVGYARTPLVYGPLTTGVMAALALVGGGLALTLPRRAEGGPAPLRRTAAAWTCIGAAAVVVIALALGLKEAGILVLPAVAVAAASRLPRPGRALAVAALLGLGAGLALAGPGGPLEPALAAFRAYAGSPAEALAAAARSPLLSGFVGGSLGCILLAGAGTWSLLRDADVRRRWLGASLGVAAVALVLPLAPAAKGDHGMRHAPLRRFVPALAPLTLLAASSVRAVPGSIGALVVMAALLPDGVALARELAAPRFTLRDAQGALARTLGPGARVLGNHAFALTATSRDVTEAAGPAGSLGGGEGRFLDPEVVRARGFTHIAQDLDGQAERIAAHWSARGTPLISIGHVVVRGAVIPLFRLPDAEARGYVPTPAERRGEARVRERGRSSRPASRSRSTSRRRSGSGPRRGGHRSALPKGRAPRFRSLPCRRS